VVFTSSLTGEEQVRRGLEVGAHSYLRKPLSLENVLETLDHVFALGTDDSLDETNESLQILNEIINSAKQAFNIMTGNLTSFDGYSNVPAEYTSKTWDYAGTISTEGAATVTVSSGLSAEQLGRLGASMMGGEIADEDLLMGCQQELLNVILGGPVGVISKTRPVKLGLPVLNKNCSIGIDETAHDAFLIGFSSERLKLELVLTLSFGNIGASVH
jgi:CheY-like chemotaxis protein